MKVVVLEREKIMVACVVTIEGERVDTWGQSLRETERMIAILNE